MIQKRVSAKGPPPKPSVMYIADAIKLARNQRALSQRALSDKVGIPQGHLSKIENGEVDPRLSSLIEIARALEYEIVFVPRTLLPAIRSLERQTFQTSKPTSLEVKTTVQELNKVQQDAQKLAKELPDSKEVQKLLTVIREIQKYKLDPRFAVRIQEIIEQMRPAFEAIIAARLHVQNWADHSNTQRQLQQIVKATTALQQTRNALAHGAVAPPSEPVPAYQLSAGDE